MPPQKHIIESGVTNVASTTQTSILLAKGTINPDPFSDATQCRAGSIIGALNIQLDVTYSDVAGAAPVYFDWFTFFNINDAQTPPTADNIMGSAGNDLLQQVFHQDGTMLTSPGTTLNAPEWVSKWRVQVAVPKSWSKIMRGDTIRLYFKFSQAKNCYVKIRVIYKEYFP